MALSTGDGIPGGFYGPLSPGGKERSSGGGSGGTRDSKQTLPEIIPPYTKNTGGESDIEFELNESAVDSDSESGEWKWGAPGTAHPSLRGLVDRLWR